jgi:hypothetical protein
MPHEWFASAAALGALVAGLAIVLPTFAGEGVRLSMMSPRVGGVTAFMAMPSTSTGALVLATSLLLYAAGLFAPLRERS